MAKTEVEVVIKGTDKASGVFKGIGISAKKMGVAMTAVGVAAIGMGVASVKAFAAAGDEVQKMALRTSFSTEALSELKHAAELSGASLNTIEKASKKLSKAMVDASDGLETYKRAFDKLGLSTADLMKLSPEEQFNAVSQALADLENETLKVALAQDLFGRAGTQLLPMLEQGAEGIKDMRQEAHELGMVFSQEAADSAAEFNDAMTRLTGSLNGVKFAIANELIPTLTGFTDKLRDAVTSIVSFAKENSGLFKTLVTLTMGFGGLMLLVGPLLIGLPHLVTGFALVKVAAIALTGSLAATLLVVTALVAGFAMLGWGIGQLIKNANIRKANEEFNALREAVVNATQPDNVDRLTRALADLYEEQVKRGFRIAADDMDAWVEQVRAGVFATADLVSGINALTAAQDKARDAAIEHLNALNALKAGSSALAGLFPGGFTSEAEARLWAPELGILSQMREQRIPHETDPYRVGSERTEREGTILINVDGMSLDQVLGEKVLQRQRTGG